MKCNQVISLFIFLTILVSGAVSAMHQSMPERRGQPLSMGVMAASSGKESYAVREVDQCYFETGKGMVCSHASLGESRTFTRPTGVECYFDSTKGSVCEDQSRTKAFFGPTRQNRKEAVESATKAAAKNVKRITRASPVKITGGYRHRFEKESPKLPDRLAYRNAGPSVN